jgi:hypothetical protein
LSIPYAASCNRVALAILIAIAMARMRSNSDLGLKLFSATSRGAQANTALHTFHGKQAGVMAKVVQVCRRRLFVDEDLHTPVAPFGLSQRQIRQGRRCAKLIRNRIAIV